MRDVAEIFAAVVIVVLCTPLGWVGMLVLGLVIQGLRK